MNRNCSVCNIIIDENNYLKHKTVCKSCYNKNRRKNKTIEKKIVTTAQQPKVDETNNNNDNVPKYENHACVIVGPRNVGKTYYMLKVLDKIGNERPVHIITRSSNQNPEYKTSTEIKPINKYKGSVVFLMIC